MLGFAYISLLNPLICLSYNDIDADQSLNLRLLAFTIRLLIRCTYLLMKPVAVFTCVISPLVIRSRLVLKRAFSFATRMSEGRRARILGQRMAFS